MGFESVRGYVGLASGLSDLTRARAKDAAQSLLSVPVAGLATGGRLAVAGLLSLPTAALAIGSKIAVGAGSLAEELFSAATANRSNLKTLVRSEVDVAVTHLGLVPVQTLADAEAEAARLRAEVARLRASSSSAAPRKSAAPGSTAKRNGARTARTSPKAGATGNGNRSAVTTRARPAGA